MVELKINLKCRFTLYENYVHALGVIAYYVFRFSIRLMRGNGKVDFYVRRTLM
jgi:hypothetical protein